MRTSFRDPLLQRQLQEIGFVQIRLFAASDVERTASALLSNYMMNMQRVSSIGELHLTYHSTVLDTDEEYRIVLFNSIKSLMEPALSNLLERYKIFSAGLVVKEPGTGALALHSDPSHTEDLELTSLTIWSPLVDTDAGNGGLVVIPGSHAITRQINGPGIAEYHWPYRAAIAKHAQHLSVKAGEAVIFNNRLIHGSPNNQGAQSRPAMMVSCVPEETRPVFYIPDPVSNGSRLLVFDHSDGRYLRHPASQFFSGQVADTLIGSVVNPNHPVSLQEFERRLAGNSSAPHNRTGILSTLRRTLGL